MKTAFLALCFLLLLSVSTQGQSFNSGSTGADGALDLTAGSLTLQLPASGIFNFTTINIPSGRTLGITRNLQNTPVIMLAQGNVTIGGTIDVSAGGGAPRNPGPGGFHGGINNQQGFGPGGGQPGGNLMGRWVGPLSLVPIIGGSGGAGWTAQGFYGGGGGGAIVIASSTLITLTGSIVANGVGGASSLSDGGAGGAIRLVANSLNISGSLQAREGDSAGGASNGVIRLEAPLGALTFTGTATPPAILSAINPIIIPSATPTLTIVSIGGFPVPSVTGQRFDTADLLLPNQLSDPISVVVQAANIPVGTQVNVTFSGSPSATFAPGTLSGTEASSSAILTISGLNRTQVTYLFVSATFNVPSSLINRVATNRSRRERVEVAKVRVEAAPGAKSKYVFLRHDGSLIDSRKVPQEILRYFGQ